MIEQTFSVFVTGIIGLLSLVCCSRAAVSDDALPPTARPDVHVQLSISVKEFDPANPAQQGHRVMVWDWRAMPAPPPTPIHLIRGDGFLDHVSFRVTLTINGAPVTSDAVELKVK